MCICGREWDTERERKRGRAYQRQCGVCMRWIVTRVCVCVYVYVCVCERERMRGRERDGQEQYIAWIKFFFWFFESWSDIKKENEREREKRKKGAREIVQGNTVCVFFHSWCVRVYIFFDHDVCVYSVESLFYNIEYILYTHHRMCSIKNTLRILYESRCVNIL